MTAQKYDVETANGIPYISRLYISNYRYRDVVDSLDRLKPQKDIALSGGQYKSYGLQDRSVERAVMSPERVLALWEKLMADKERLEGGRSRRQTVGVVIRDL